MSTVHVQFTTFNQTFIKIQILFYLMRIGLNSDQIGAVNKKRFFKYYFSYQKIYKKIYCFHGPFITFTWCRPYLCKLKHLIKTVLKIQRLFYLMRIGFYSDRIGAVNIQEKRGKVIYRFCRNLKKDFSNISNILKKKYIRCCFVIIMP